MPTQEKRFLKFSSLLSCFPALLEVEKTSGIQFPVLYMILQRRGCFKGQKTGLEMGRSCVSLLAVLSAWAVTCCQAAPALHST